ncbi:glycosyltransferase family 2 protein [Alisedimentitalea sp. MJ-SS2]|uniref:glycosyltransferase family 2 protein n=1 Tax=Aliisedimentitalea sp. MJ-SS2 TaxID=3049795 RepID=UPI0029128AC5|nr:glycosyltransferase family 2 protein [Alisedimentitalea sp. MJ-SS2]MDU8926687.1 glycosyltransferase family 2 protein [Alisedimentitalea sp. MJ-SS2]
MKLILHIGLEQVGAERLQSVLNAKREGLLSKGVLYPRSPGSKNHTRLYMAVSDPDHIDPLRYNRGYIAPASQADLREQVAAGLAREVETHKPDLLILSASQLGSSLARMSELERLKALLSPLTTDIEVVAHIDEPGRLLSRHYASQVLEGRAAPLDLEFELAGSADWWGDALLDAHQIDPQAGQFLETQTPAFWLDYARLVKHWEGVFGQGSMSLRPYDADRLHGVDVTGEIRDTFGITANIGRAEPVDPPAHPSAAWLARARQLNELLLKVLGSRKRILPRMLWRKFINEIAIDGPAIDPGALSEISTAFAPASKALLKAHPALTKACLTPDPAADAWEEADPGNGYRASQYLLSFMWRIDKATREAKTTKLAALNQLNGSAHTAEARAHATAPAGDFHGKSAASGGDEAPADGLSEVARKIMPPLAQQNFEKLQHSSFAPHNRLGRVNEEELAAAYAEITPRDLPKNNSGNVIVGCMKNEAPYIVEWIAYHRAMGIDNFLIYTNDCSDGTSEILNRLQELGVLQHRNNDNWKGNSPQQYALNQALKEPVIKNAEWIAHIDVDEFINVRCGNGTLADFFEHVPDATNVAMTWRLFGHNGVTDLADELVIQQFDTCAPKFCPKPHTVWGFKTMFRNIGAYAKISCHRPNKLDDAFKGKVRWVNGSGHDMTREAAEKGWRSSKKSIGYDLIQLNHYALRSAESYLIKRQRGRALHVDRSIGINYWIRMDWSNFRDITIKRNIPRTRAEMDRLLADGTLNKLHQSGLAWHRAKADELHGMPEFQDLYEQALTIKLTETERVAYALALDMES